MATKPPKRMTRPRLRNIAMAYVQRYGGSSKRLHDVLVRRAERSLRYHDELERRPEVDDWIKGVVEELKTAGVSDDRRNARASAAQQSLQGRPLRAIRQRLQLKGYDRDSIDYALEALTAHDEEDAAQPDWVACCRYARRRRLGPFRNPMGRVRGRDKELAALMRAGFNYGYASRVVDAQCADTLQRVIDEAPLPSIA